MDTAGAARRSDAAHCLAIARSMVAGKIQNARQMLLRARREADAKETVSPLDGAGAGAGRCPAEDRDRPRLGPPAGDRRRRGPGVLRRFGQMIREDREAFAISGRNRRPPRDRTNALLSFLYALLVNDCASAAEGVGLDPQVGFLHALRRAVRPWRWTSWKNCDPYWPTAWR